GERSGRARVPRPVEPVEGDLRGSRPRAARRTRSRRQRRRGRRRSVGRRGEADGGRCDVGDRPRRDALPIACDEPERARGQDAEVIATRAIALRAAAIVLAAAAIAAPEGEASAGPADSIAITAELPPAIAPPWSAGIQPINRDSYWNAIACGKQGGQRPLCVFYDAVLCANDDYTLAMFTPYKLVAYEVWRAVRQKQEPPTPSYAEAQRT